MAAEQQGAHAQQIDRAMSAVRGRAEASQGAVIVETDAYGTITDLQISPAAMTVDPARLAAAITGCHRRAREEAEAAAAELLGRLARDGRPAPPAAATEQWDDDAPVRITYRL
ncbi:YbaB/EbfC family nucleoid-associated protein [Nocardia sp. CC227C]|uniref:YbaB/EbfC family nucleoid-associated protein n=1 Tax=Nocardia sp. CC227C TaxID=3044562 RepID=UPI00278C1792|nr:YbaB/EbfC family nucleoid-associated protein [Nocardia sp. CC227C]